MSSNQEIFSAISLCNYPPNVTDYLITSINQIMNYKYVKSKPQYKVKLINKEKIIAIRIQMDIPFNKKNYDVPIVVFFPILIPLESPKIFIEVLKGSAINPKVKDIIKMIINLAKMFNTTSVAEGVETEAQYLFLKESGCDVIQGYYLSKPLPLEEFESLLIKEKNDER